MAVKLGAEVGQLRVVNGVRQERVTCLGSFEQPTSLFRRRDQGRLFVVVELTGDELGRDALYEDLVQLAGSTYYHTPGSVTAGLRAALHEVNARLLRENRGLSPGEGRLAGISCAVLRGDDLYIAQAGPALAYLASQGQLLTFPDSPSPVDWLAERPMAPLGSQRAVEVRFFHCTVQPGDVLLLVQPTWGQQISPEQIGKAVTYTGTVLAMNNLQALADQSDAAFLVVEITGTLEGAPQATPPVARPRRSQYAPPQTVEAKPREAPPVRKPLAQRGITARLEELNLTAKLRAVGRGSLAALALVLDFLRRLLGRLLPGREGKAPQKARVAPERKTTSGVSSPLVIWMAAAIPIIIILLVVGVYLQQGSSRQAESGILIAQAQSEYEQGQVNEGNAPVAREHYKRALALLGQVLETRKNDQQAQALQRKVQEALDKIDGVYRLYDLTPLYTYKEPNSIPGRVIADAQHIFVLDKGTGRVYHHVLNELGQDLQETAVIAQKGQSVDGAATGDLIDMAWRPDGGDHHRGSLLILDGNGRLLEYDPIFNTVSARPLGGLSQWRSPQVVGTYFDQTKTNFYILDTGLNQILKYVPGENLYAEAPVSYTVEEVDLSGAVDMAIDGYIYVLYADGRVLKLYTGRPEDFILSGLADPLAGPTAIFTANHGAAVKYLYIADTGNRRILRLNKDGSFVHQFRAADEQAFAQIRGVFVEEALSQPRLFVVSENRLYAFSIPPESRPE